MLQLFLCIMFSQSTSTAEPAPQLETLTSYLPFDYQNQGSEPHFFVPFKERIYFIAKIHGKSALAWTDGVATDWVQLPNGSLAFDVDDTIVRVSNAHAPEVHNDGLYFYTAEGEDFVLWRIADAPESPERVFTFPQSKTARLFDVSQGLMVGLFNRDQSELFILTRGTVSSSGVLPHTNAYWFHAAQLDGRIYFVLGNEQTGFALWRWHTGSSGPVRLKELDTQLEPENRHSVPNFGTRLMTASGQLLLILDLGWFHRDTYLYQVNPQSGALGLVEHAAGIQTEAGLTQSMVINASLFLRHRLRGVLWYDGSRLRPLSVLNQDFNLLSPKELVSDHLGFYFTADQKPLFGDGPEIEALFGYGVADKTLGRMYAQEGHRIDHLQIMAGHRLGFHVFDPTGGASSGLWVGGIPNGPRKITDLKPKAFEWVNDALLFSHEDEQLGREPHLVIDGVPTLLADLENDPCPQYKAPAVQVDQRAYHMAQTEAGRQVLLVEDGAVQTLPLGELQADELQISGDQVFVIADQRHTLYRLEDQALNPLTTVPDGDQISRALVLGDDLYYTGRVNTSWKNRPSVGLSVENHLNRIDEDGDVLINDEPSVPGGAIQVTPFGDGVLYTEAREVSEQLKYHALGENHLLLEQGADPWIRESITLMPASKDVAYLNVNRSMLPGANPNATPLGNAYYAVTPDELTLLWDGQYPRTVLVVNQRLILQVGYQILAFSPDGTELLHEGALIANVLEPLPGRDDLFFISEDQLWQSDGTAAGTQSIRNIDIAGRHLAIVGQTHYFLKRKYGSFHFDNPGILYVQGPQDPTAEPVQTGLEMPYNDAVWAEYEGDLYVVASTQDIKGGLWRVVDGVATLMTPPGPEGVAGRVLGLRSAADGLYVDMPQLTQTGLRIERLTFANHTGDTGDGDPNLPDEPNDGGDPGTGTMTDPDPDPDVDPDPETGTLPAPTLSAPEVLAPGQTGVAQLLDAPVGAMVTWSIGGGQLLWKPQGGRHLFLAGPSEKVVITATITHPDGRPWTVSSVVEINAP